MELKAGIRSATIFISLGFLSLGASVAMFVDRSSSTKLGPSLVQGILDGFGMLWLHILYFLAGFTLLHGVAGWALHWLARPFLQNVQRDEEKRGQSNLLILLLAFLFLVLEAAGRFRKCGSRRCRTMGYRPRPCDRSRYGICDTHCGSHSRAKAIPPLSCAFHQRDSWPGPERLECSPATRATRKIRESAARNPDRH